MHTISDGPAAVEKTAELTPIALSARGRALLKTAASPDDFLKRLLLDRLDVDAIPILAYTLPVRKAVWWGTLCAWHASAGNPPTGQDQALGAAARWVVGPTAERGQAAKAAAIVATIDNAAGCCAKAAFLAGAQTSPEGPFVAGRPLLAARLIGSAVIFAFSRCRERDPKVTYRHFAELGREVAAGKHRWEPLPA